MFYNHKYKYRGRGTNKLDTCSITTFSLTILWSIVLSKGCNGIITLSRVCLIQTSWDETMEHRTSVRIKLLFAESLQSLIHHSVRLWYSLLLMGTAPLSSPSFSTPLVLAKTAHRPEVNSVHIRWNPTRFLPSF